MRIALLLTVRVVTDRIANWFDDYPSFFSLFIIALFSVAGILFISFLIGCPVQTRYKGYFLNVTSYDLKNVEWKQTSKGIKVWLPPKYLNPEKIHAEIDKRTDELEKCFRDRSLISTSIRRDWFAVYIPPDWYTSRCGTREEQLIPSRVDYRLCEAKGLTIPIQCRKVERPTKECPCPCNVRSCIQNSWVIVTAPNLKLYKTELSRLVLYPRANAPWTDKEVAPCLK